MFVSVPIQNIGVVGLWELQQLRVLLLAGNPDLALPEVMASLTGRWARCAVAELLPPRTAPSVTTLEVVDFGLPSAVRAAGGGGGGAVAGGPAMCKVRESCMVWLRSLRGPAAPYS